MTHQASRGQPGATDEPALAIRIHRELLQLALLVVVAVTGFFVTRAAATASRTAMLRDGEAWYAEGQALVRSGRSDDAVAAFRRAAVRNRYDRRYGLALAGALAAVHDTDQARATLLTLREAAPEDAEIDLALARVAAERRDLNEAVRFYHSALYAPWPAEAAAARRAVRFELIELLLRNDQRDRALPELLAASNDVPADSASHVRIGQLFARAGDQRHALDQFRAALAAAPHDAAALAGAGLSAFQLGLYRLADAYLRAAPDDSSDVVRARAIAEAVLARDPLAPRIGSHERRRRLLTDLDDATLRLAACSSGSVDSPADPGLLDDAAAFRDELNRARSTDQDLLEAGIDLLGRLQRRIAAVCGPPGVADEALRLIVEAHEGAGR